MNKDKWDKFWEERKIKTDKAWEYLHSLSWPITYGQMNIFDKMHKEALQSSRDS